MDFLLLCRDCEQVFRKIVSIRVNTLSNTNLVTSIRQIEREKSTLPVDVTFLSKTSLDVGKDGPKMSWCQLMSYPDVSERQSCI